MEALTLADGTTLHYVNTCDTYRATLCHVAGRGYFVSSWGDEYEGADRAHEVETGERRCAYCSAWADPAVPRAAGLSFGCAAEVPQRCVPA